MTWSRRKTLHLNDTMNKDKMFKKKVRKVNPNVAVRKIRIIYNDPDATDSSSDEQSNDQFNKNGERVKRVTREVYIPINNSSEESGLSVRAGGTKRIKGVRRREGGKFAAEIRDPIEKRKIWIGTYATEREAHEAYMRKEIEINIRMLALNEKNSKTTELCSGALLDVVDNVQGSTKSTICPMDEVVVIDDSDVEIVDDPRLSEPVVKILLDYPYDSVMNFDDFMFDQEEELLQLVAENYSPLRSPLPNFEWGKEEFDWFYSL